ncbi:RAxF-45 family protein [Metabacillus arenae]|nr:RAxF-45 family protein [Metabacillus arenae]
MNQSVVLRAQMLDFIYLCRAIFHVVVVNGIRMPFYNNCIMTSD